MEVEVTNPRVLIELEKISKACGIDIEDLKIVFSSIYIKLQNIDKSLEVMHSIGG